MFYYSKNSRNKIIHVRGCHYIKNTDEAKLGDFKTVAAAYREGYNPCHHCSNILKLYRKEKKKVAKYKKENAIGIRLFPRYIEIKTDCGEWRILPSSTQGKTHLFHKNYKHRRSDYESEIPGFHDQCVSRNTLKDYVGYIVHHDKERAAEIWRLRTVTGKHRKISATATTTAESVSRIMKKHSITSRLAHSTVI